MPDKGRSFGDFLTEKSIGGGSFNRLKKWKDDGYAIVWIHTASSMFRRLLHIIPYVVTKKNEKTGKEENTISYFYFVCHEEVSDYLNRKNSGYPKRCPICRMIDFLRSNEFDLDETVWDASIGNRKLDRIITVADMTGDEKGDWRLSLNPSIEYLFAVIDDDDVASGVVVATEKYSLGESLKKSIIDTIDSKGVELGDPSLNPYAFKFEYNAKSKKPADYYNAHPYEKAKLTKEIIALLDGPPLNLKPMVAPGDTVRLREIMEECIKMDLPMDMFFDNVLENDPGDDDSFNVDEIEEAIEARANAPRLSTKESQKVEPKPTPEDDDVADDGSCPICKGTGERNGKLCKTCNGTGEVSLDDEPEVKEEPKPTTKKRTPTKKKEPEPEPEQVEFDSECGHCGAPMTQEMNECPKCHSRYD